ncbi:murein hydrolase activator EnvC family protein [Endothiovibrio diazotrophicus]
MTQRRRPLPILLICAALAAAAALPPPSPAADRLGAKQAELEQLRKRIGTVQRDLERARGRQSEVEREFAASERQVANIASLIASLDHKLADQQRSLDKLRGEREQQHEALGGQRQELARQVRAAHALGRQERLKLLLNQEEPARAGRLMVYYDYFHRARAEHIATISNRLSRLDRLEREIREESRQLAQMKGEREREAAKLSGSQEQQRQLLVRLEREIERGGRKLERLRADESALAKLIDSLREALARVPEEPPRAHTPNLPFSRLKGRLGWPTRGRVAATFGAPRELGDFHWQGLLIRAPEGREVHAVARGRVAYADWLRGYGMLIILDHGHGYMSLYGYNRNLYRRVGEWVEAGETIAQVGASGGRKENALYFEIRRRGKPINPRPWLAKR